MAAAYKDIVVGLEDTWGVNGSSPIDRLHITDVSIDDEPNKDTVKDTSGVATGRHRVTLGPLEVTGSMSGRLSPRSFHWMTQLANGTGATTAACGLSASTWTYAQSEGGSNVSYEMWVDRESSTQDVTGIVPTEFSTKIEDNELAWSLNYSAKNAGITAGALITAAVGETVENWAWSDLTVTVHEGATYGPSTHTLYVDTADWTFNPAIEVSHASGSRYGYRFDKGIPELTGSFSIFHDGPSWSLEINDREFYYVRMEATLSTSGGLIAGVTPYYVKIDIPSTTISRSIKTYEQAGLFKEELQFLATVDNDKHKLWLPSMVAGQSVN